MMSALRYWRAVLLCIGATLVLSQALISRLSYTSGATREHRSVLPDLVDTDLNAVAIRNPAGTVNKRASDEWNENVSRADKYICNFDSQDGRLASPHTDYNLIAQEYERQDEECKLRGVIEALNAELTALGLAQSQWQTSCLQWQARGLISKKDNIPYWNNLFNPDGGAIIAVDNQKMNQANPNVPTVNQLSDVLYLVWSQLTNGANRRNLSKVIRSSVGEATEEIIKEAIGTSDKSQARWPGREFGPDTQAFKALLGSPNGSGVAYLLFTHKQQLGMKKVSKVTVFSQKNQDGDDAWHLVWYIEPVQT